MPALIKSPIIVIGGGVAGIGTALKLANEGYKVTLIEKNTLMSGSSGRNPGRMGLGFHYFDEATAIMYLKASILVQKTYPDFLIGKDLPFEHPVRHGRYYVVKNSAHSYDEILKIYRGIQREYAEMVAADPTNKVFGEPETFFRELQPHEYQNVVNNEIVVGAVETNEHLFNWPLFLSAIRRLIQTNSNITLLENTEVLKIIQRDTLDYRFKVLVESDKVDREYNADFLINAAWENIEYLNSTLGIPYLEGSRTNRLKCLLEVNLPPELVEANSSFFCMGPFCMFSNMGNGRGMMTFADVTNFAVSSSLRIDKKMEYYLSSKVSREEKLAIGAEILSGVTHYIPAMVNAQIIDVKFGIVQTKGQLLLDDLKSNSAFSNLKSQLSVKAQSLVDRFPECTRLLDELNLKRILLLVGLEGILNEENLKNVFLIGLDQGLIQRQDLTNEIILELLNTPSAFDKFLLQLGLTTFKKVFEGHHKRNYFGIRQEQQGLISNPAMKLFYFILNSEKVYTLLKDQFMSELILKEFTQGFFSRHFNDSNIEYKRSVLKYIDFNLPDRNGLSVKQHLKMLETAIENKKNLVASIAKVIPNLIVLWSKFKEKSALYNQKFLGDEFYHLINTNLGAFLKFRESMFSPRKYIPMKTKTHNSVSFKFSEDEELERIFIPKIEPILSHPNSFFRAKSATLFVPVKEMPYCEDLNISNQESPLPSTKRIRSSSISFCNNPQTPLKEVPRMCY